MATIGTCGSCGGPVQTPEFWGGIIPPTPTCVQCGSTAKNAYGPLIPMKGKKQHMFGWVIDWTGRDQQLTVNSMTNPKITDAAVEVAERTYERAVLAGATHEQAWHEALEAALPHMQQAGGVADATDAEMTWEG